MTCNILYQYTYLNILCLQYNTLERNLFAKKKKKRIEIIYMLKLSFSIHVLKYKISQFYKKKISAYFATFYSWSLTWYKTVSKYTANAINKKQYQMVQHKHSS